MKYEMLVFSIISGDVIIELKRMAGSRCGEDN